MLLIVVQLKFLNCFCFPSKTTNFLDLLVEVSSVFSPSVIVLFLSAWVLFTFSLHNKKRMFENVCSKNLSKIPKLWSISLYKVHLCLQPFVSLVNHEQNFSSCLTVATKTTNSWRQKEQQIFFTPSLLSFHPSQI